MAKVTITIPGDSGSAEIPHNELDGLQGGGPNEYFHLTEDQYDNLPSILDIPTNTSDLTNDGEDGTNPFITLLDLPSPLGLQGTLDIGNSANDVNIILSNTSGAYTEYKSLGFESYSDDGLNFTLVNPGDLYVGGNSGSGELFGMNPLGLFFQPNTGGQRDVQFMPQSISSGKILFQDVLGSTDEVLAFLSDIPTPTSQNLQSVLDTGNTALDQIIGLLSSDFTLQTSIDSGLINLINTSIGTYSLLEANYLQFADNANISTSVLSSENISFDNTVNTFRLNANGYLEFREFAGQSTTLQFQNNPTNNVILKLPNKNADGDYTIATLDDITAPTTILATSIVDGDTTHAPDGNAVYDALDLKVNKSRIIYHSYTSITGVTGVQVMASLLIPANTYDSIDAFEVIVSGQKSATASPIIYAMYHSTTLNGTTNAIATATALSAANRTGSVQRIISLDSGLARVAQQPNNISMTPYNASSGIGFNFAFNPAVNNYITITVNPTVITEVIEVTSIAIRPLK